jgi:hypothetical protein
MTFDPVFSICRRIYFKQDWAEPRMEQNKLKQNEIHLYNENKVQSNGTTKPNNVTGTTKYTLDKQSASTQRIELMQHIPLRQVFSSPGTLHHPGNLTSGHQVALNALFPVWAIALLVLIGVIIMVSIVLIMY